MVARSLPKTALAGRVTQVWAAHDGSERREVSTTLTERTVELQASDAIVDAIAVADVQPSFGTEAPDRMLHEAGEIGRPVWA